MTDQNKRELRRELLAGRRSMTATNRENQDRVVRATAASWLARMATDATPDAGFVVAAYRPMIGEPGGPELPNALAATARPLLLLLPVVLDDRDLDWAAFDPTAPDGGLVPASLGLHEPTGARLGVDAITRAAVIFVPALAVDHHGTRLGRGGGSFDRALSRVRAPQLVIALLYDGELRATVPAESHDLPVDGVVIGDEVTIFHKM